MPYNDLPIGVGPFVFDRWEWSREVVLAVNPRYWRGRPKPAFVDDVPSIVSFLRVDLFAYNRDLKHYNPNTITPFDNMMDVDN